MIRYTCPNEYCSCCHHQEAGFFLKADFVWYNNSLDTYPDISSGDSEDCCFNQRSCSDDCITRLRYCFKEYKTVTNISNDKFSGTGCNGTRFSSLLKPVEFIDYSEPPRDMTHNNTISRSITYRGSDDWPVSHCTHTHTHTHTHKCTLLIELFTHRESSSCL